MAVQAAIFSSKKSGSGIFDCAIWELFEQKEAWGDIDRWASLSMPL